MEYKVLKRNIESAGGWSVAEYRTRTRLNAVIMIVGDGKLVEALKYIRESIKKLKTIQNLFLR